MPNWLWFIFGILFWQLVFTIIDIITDENKQIIIPVGAGFWVLLIWASGNVYKYIRFEYLKRNYNGYRFGCGKKVYGELIYIHNKDIEKFNFDDTKDYYLVKFSNGSTWKSAPYESEIYKNQKYYYGWDLDLFKKED